MSIVLFNPHLLPLFLAAPSVAEASSLDQMSSYPGSIFPPSYLPAINMAIDRTTSTLDLENR